MHVFIKSILNYLFEKMLLYNTVVLLILEGITFQGFNENDSFKDL